MNHPTHNPLEKLQQWLAEAANDSRITEPTAMTVATADANGFPAARILLLKGLDERGAVFYTNSHSQKGHELAENPRVSLLFYWMPLQRQIRISGHATQVTEAESDAYFASRRRISQAGAWASQQSQPLDSFDELMQRVEEIDQRYAGTDIPRPPHWFGWRVALERIEFWQEGDFRLHHREVYMKDGEGWTHTLLNP